MEAEVHADFNGVKQSTVTRQNRRPTPQQQNEPVLTTTDSEPEIIETISDAPFQLSKQERRNILRGVKGKNPARHMPTKVSSISNRLSKSSSSPNCKYQIRASKTDQTSNFLIYVGKLEQNTTVDDLRSHLLQIGVLNVNIADVMKLKCRNEQESSFCISVNCMDAKDLIFTKQCWPEGVRIRKYNMQKKHQTNKEVTRSQNQQPL